MLRLLEQAGLEKSPAQTPLEFAASLPAAEVAVPVASLTELYLVARFGRAEAGGNRSEGSRAEHAADADRFVTLLADVQAALRLRRTTSA
jgi:hypothetical protein